MTSSTLWNVKLWMFQEQTMNFSFIKILHLKNKFAEVLFLVVVNFFFGFSRKQFYSIPYKQLFTMTLKGSLNSVSLLKSH